VGSLIVDSIFRNGSRHICMRRPFQASVFLVRVVYVSTDMHVMTIPARDAMTLANDLVQQDGNKRRTYRRLTLRYWAWLRAQLSRAAAMVDDGRVSPEAYRAASLRMALCDHWIEEGYTADQINAATTAAPIDYQPPQRIRSVA